MPLGTRESLKFVPGDHRMAGVGPALITDDDVVLFGQQVDDLPFGFIAPLQTDHTSRGHRLNPQ